MGGCFPPLRPFSPPPTKGPPAGLTAGRGECVSLSHATNPRSKSVSSTFFFPLFCLGPSNQAVPSFSGLSCYSPLGLSAATHKWPPAGGKAVFPSKSRSPFPTPLPIRADGVPARRVPLPVPHFLLPSPPFLPISAAAFFLLQKQQLLRQELGEGRVAWPPAGGAEVVPALAGFARTLRAKGGKRHPSARSSAPLPPSDGFCIQLLQKDHSRLRLALLQEQSLLGLQGKSKAPGHPARKFHLEPKRAQLDC